MNNKLRCLVQRQWVDRFNWRIKNYLSEFPLMQTANVKGKDETYARCLHCLPRCRQLLRRRILIVDVSLGTCHRYRLSAWRSK